MHIQKIFFGAPGTGKSYKVDQIINGEKVFRTIIHPEYSYSDFVGQLIPEKNSNNDLVFNFKEGIFTQALKEAYNDFSKPVYLVLEEISRGNVSAIMGDIFQLLDRDVHSKSRYAIKNDNIADRISQIIGNDVVLPSNFNIIATVNMNDQNVFPMDTAFKRRFEWEYVSTVPVVDANNNIITKLNNPAINVLHDNNKINTNWQSFYSALNQFITDRNIGLGKSEDKQIGQFFLEFDKTVIVNSHQNNGLEVQAEKVINTLIKNKLLLYLWQDVQGNSIFSSNVSLFDKEISSFDDLYFNYDNKQVFSSDFIDNFLIPNQQKYPY